MGALDIGMSFRIGSLSLDHLSVIASYFTGVWLKEIL
jgi:hypothetical protein